MEKEKLELYSDYLIGNNGYATAAGLSAMLDGDVRSAFSAASLDQPGRQPAY